jgi:hypothetical protein
MNPEGGASAQCREWLGAMGWQAEQHSTISSQAVQVKFCVEQSMI